MKAEPPGVISTEQPLKQTHLVGGANVLSQNYQLQPMRTRAGSGSAFNFSLFCHTHRGEKTAE